MKGHPKSHSAGRFDWQQLRQLAGEDSEFEAELMTLFLQDMVHSLQQLECAIATESTETIEEVAHSLRGASANVGASALSAVALQLEQTARRGELTGARRLLRQLNQQCRWIQTQFRNK